MESAKLSKNEIIDLIFYGLNANNIDLKSIKRSEIESIFVDYIMNCNHLQVAYIRGELDTFKRAACLLIAINKRSLSKDKRVNASIALDTAYKMCEKPFWNVGGNNDVTQKLEEVSFKKAFENNMSAYNKTKEMLIDSLVYDKGDPLSYEINLQLLYHIALESIHNPIQIIAQESILQKNQLI